MQQGFHYWCYSNVQNSIFLLYKVLFSKINVNIQFVHLPFSSLTVQETTFFMQNFVFKYTGTNFVLYFNIPTSCMLLKQIELVREALHKHVFFSYLIEITKFSVRLDIDKIPLPSKYICSTLLTGFSFCSFLYFSFNCIFLIHCFIKCKAHLVKL